MSEKNRKPLYQEQTMMDKETRLVLFGSLIIYLFAGIMHLLEKNGTIISFRADAISEILYMAFCIMLAFYLRFDVPNKRSRNYFVAMSLLIYAWQIVHIVEDELYTIGSVGYIYTWYLYYPPTIMIPVLLLFAVKYSMLPNGHRINKKWYFILAIGGALSLFTMFNDLHHAVIIFHEGIENSHLKYSFGPVYYIIMAFVAVVSTLCITEIYRHLASPAAKRRFYMACIIGGIAVVFLAVRSFGKSFMPWVHMMYETPELWGFIVLLATEIFVRNGLIRTNFNYLDFFYASTFPMAIADNNEQVFYNTAGGEGIKTSERQRKESLDSPVFLDADLKLHGAVIDGGYAYWVEDLGPINKVSRELTQVNERLSQDNEIIRAENEMKARKIRADEQNKMYDMLAKELSPYYDKIETLLDVEDKEGEGFRKNLARACVYKAYVKRFSNLTLLSSEKERLNIYELESSIREYLDYVELNGIKSDMISDAKQFYDADVLINMFRSLHEIIEPRLETVEDITVKIHDLEDAPEVTVLLTGAKLKKEEMAWQLQR